MDTASARALCALNNRFYAENARSFSQTRAAAWDGWLRCLDAAGLGRGAAGDAAPEAIDVLDVGAGNLRFERFLADALPCTRVRAVAVDACEELAGEAADVPGVEFRRMDVLGPVLSAGDNAAPGSLWDLPACDLVVCFGLLHHVPGRAARERLMRELVGHARPGGIVAVSLWRFMEDGRLARKARETAARAARDPRVRELAACLEQGDYLLGWQEAAGAYRYCHSFCDADVDRLAGCVAGEAEVVARFSADGRSGRLNAYLVLRRSGQAYCSALT